VAHLLVAEEEAGRRHGTGELCLIKRLLVGEVVLLEVLPRESSPVRRVSDTSQRRAVGLFQGGGLPSTDRWQWSLAETSAF